MNKVQKSPVDRSLKFSFLDGIFANAMIGFTQDYFTPFLLLLGGQARHVGFLTALPNLFGALVQVKSADLTEKLKSRKKIINVFVFLHLLTLLPMAAMALFAYKKPSVFILLVVLFSSLQAVALPGWSSLMSDLVSQDRRGDYFGWRNRTLGLIAVALALAAGLILNFTKKINIFYGFALLFLFAFIFRSISWYFLIRMHEPPIAIKKEHSFTLWEFVARWRQSNFGRFVLFAAVFNFTIFLAAPFFAVFMIKELSFSYILYSGLTATATLTIYLAMRRWGRCADRFGNLRIIKLSALLISLNPLFWLFSHNPLFLFFAQIASGFGWAGFSLCASNFIYDCAVPEKRTRCVSYYNFFVGIGIFFGGLCGGYLIRVLPPLFGHKILTLFLISALARMAVAAFAPVSIREVRPVEAIGSGRLFLNMVGITKN